MRNLVIPILMVGIAIAASTASADPISITSGGLVGDSSAARVDIASPDRSFAMSGAGDAVGGIYAPAQACAAGECTPGATLGLEAYWSGGDFLGTASIDGTTYQMNGGDSAAGAVHFHGSWTAPTFTGQQTAFVTSPFTFDGSFWYPAFSGSATPIPLVGTGTATLGLDWHPADNTWLLSSAHYVFANQSPSETPEPATLLLLATGLVGMATRRPTRRSFRG